MGFSNKDFAPFASSLSWASANASPMDQAKRLWAGKTLQGNQLSFAVDQQQQQQQPHPNRALGMLEQEDFPISSPYRLICCRAHTNTNRHIYAPGGKVYSSEACLESSRKKQQLPPSRNIEAKFSAKECAGSRPTEEKYITAERESSLPYRPITTAGVTTAVVWVSWRKFN